jgi:hypothetical protein
MGVANIAVAGMVMRVAVVMPLIMALVLIFGIRARRREDQRDHYEQEEGEAFHVS